MRPYLPVLGFLIIVLALSPMLSRSNIDILVIALWYSYLCLTWNIVGGVAGQFSFAHPVYVAAGGYTSSALFLHLGLSPWIGMFAGAALAIGLAVIMAWINFRRQLPLLTYALITLAAPMILVIILHSSEFLGGHEGLYIPRGNEPIMFRFADRTHYLYVILSAVVGMLIFTQWLLRSPLGMKLIAMRDNQQAARMLGVDVLRMAILSASLSAGLGAFGGTFYAQYISVADPSVANLHLAVQIVLLTAVGGLGTTWGPLLGPLLLIPMERYLDREFVSLAGLGHLTYGVIILVVLLVLRNGIVPWVDAQIRKRRIRSGTGGV